MNILYKKKIEAGKFSKRWIFGIPVYYRTDEKDGRIIRRYLCGIFKTIKDVGLKKYCIFNIMVWKKYDESFDKKINVLELYSKINNIFYENSNLKTLIQCQNLHKETFSPYKNIFLNMDVVLVASGPTAKFYSPIEGAIHVGVNNACLLDNVELDYLFCQDFYMDDEKRKAIINYRKGECKKFFGRIPENRMRECRKNKATQHVRRCTKKFIIEADALEYYVYDLYRNNIAIDIENEPLHAGSVAFSALQFILHTHPSKIYIVGCDCSSGFFYKSDIKFNNNGLIRYWKEFKQYIDEFYPDIEVVSINPVGLKGLFIDEYTDNYLNK